VNKQRFTFDRPRAVVQVFRNVVDMSKAAWRSGGRVDALAWPDSIASNSGGVSGDAIVLNECALHSRHDLAASDIIVIHDSAAGPLPPPDRTYRDRRLFKARARTGYLPLPPYPERDGCLHYTMISGAGGSRSCEVFKLGRTPEGLEVRLDYSGHARKIGEPRRPDYKVAELRARVPVRITLNGRVGTWEDPLYRILDYIVVYLGEYATFEVWPWNEIASEKLVPVTGARLVNLEKELY